SNLLGETVDYPFAFSWQPNEAGNFSLSAKVTYDDNSFEISQAINITVIDPPVFNLGITITSPQSGLSLEAPADIRLDADVTGAQPNNPAYLSVTNSLTGYRKLKLGYNSTSIYGPMVNPVLAGNDTLQITLRDNFGNINWSKIRLRPSATGTLNLSSYTANAGGIGINWGTIKIPLSDFDTAIDFSSMAYMEFPYSADAGNFDLDILSIRFTGGSEPFIWFGKGKTDNIHNGSGGPGELVAITIIPEPVENAITSVDFYQGSELLYQDEFQPFYLELERVQSGMYHFYAVVNTAENQTATSDTIAIDIQQPAQIMSDLSVSIISPLEGETIPNPANLQIIAEIDGLVSPEPEHLLISNELTGYRKLKLGNNPTSVYSPKINVLGDGNDTLEITIKLFDGNPDWNKIRLRPQAIGSLNLGPYIQDAGGNVDDWAVLRIPLSDFDTAIDFSNIAYLEFPYSANAGNFAIGLQKIVFKGGGNPYLWFGEGKTDNAHNGNGGDGELVAELIEETHQAITVAKVEFFLDGVKIGEDTTAPYDFNQIIEGAGTYKISARLTDTEHLISPLDSVQIIVEELTPDQGIFITVLLDNVPQYLTVSKASLKYNKHFAYSFALDDGREDAYTHAFQVLNGGYLDENNTNYPGLFYTDGCGNDIPFRASLAWNSVNASYADLHINTPDYITWDKLTEMYNAGWDVLNHSYSHAAYNGTDYNFEIAENRDHVTRLAGIDMSHFVVPSGDSNYIIPAFSQGNKVVYTKENSYLGYYNGLPIDDPINYNGLRIFRKMLYDDAFDINNISGYIDGVAANSSNSNHYWWTEFTHRVKFEQIGGSLVFPTFEYYMNYIGQTYGKNGSDRIWMAPHQEVYEYLRTRDESVLSYALNGNVLTILLDVENIPGDLRNYALTINIDSDASFSSADISGGELVSLIGSDTQKMINIKWDGTNVIKSGSIPPAEPDIQTTTSPDPGSEFVIYPNPVSGNQIHILLETEHSGVQRIAIFEMSGKLIHAEEFNLNEGSNLVSIRTIGLNPGLYFIKRTSALDGCGVRKLIVK
nr:T9SS type A sorting domain-containing protein [Bacteroidota bacterium]